MLVEFGRAGLSSIVKQQPNKVRQVLDKIKMKGMMPTLEAIFNKLGQPLPLGYSNAGLLHTLGEGVSNLNIGDSVASNEPHAEYVCLPKNLITAIESLKNGKWVEL